MRKNAWLTVLIFGVVFLCIIIVTLFTAGRAFSNSDFIEAMGSSQFRMFFIVASGSAVGLGLLCGVLFRTGRSSRKKLGPEDGTAILEFALVMPIMLMLALLMVQSSLLMGGYLCVNYAAFCSARSAVVYVPANLSGQYDDGRFAEDLEGPNNVNVSEPTRSIKMDHIRSAGVWAVMPVSDGDYRETAPRTDVLVEGLDEFFRDNGQNSPRWVSQYVGRKLAYAEEYTDVRLTDDNGEDLADKAGSNGHYRYQEHEDIHVTVKHNLYLSVPYAGWLLWELDGAAAEGDLGEGRYALPVTISSTLTNEGVRDTIDTEIFPSNN